MTVPDFIDRNTPALLRGLAGLVRIPTVNPPGDRYGEMTALLARELAAAMRGASV